MKQNAFLDFTICLLFYVRGNDLELVYLAKTFVAEIFVTSKFIIRLNSFLKCDCKYNVMSFVALIYATFLVLMSVPRNHKFCSIHSIFPCYLTPVRDYPMQSSSVAEPTFKPLWNNSFMWDGISTDVLVGLTLELSVWDSVNEAESIFLGRCWTI